MFHKQKTCGYTEKIEWMNEKRTGIKKNIQNKKEKRYAERENK